MECAANETKVIYYVDDEPIPYRIKVSVDPQTITLADIKNVLIRTNCKYFFKSLDADFGYSICVVDQYYTVVTCSHFYDI